MRKKSNEQPKGRGAPRKPRRSYRRLELEWLVFRRNYPSLTDEQAAPKFLRLRSQWIKDLGLKIGGYGRLRNASAEGQQIRSERKQRWRVVRTGIVGARLFTNKSTGEILLEEAQGRYFLGLSERDVSLAAGRV